METVRSLTSEWKEWIALNLDNGCTQQSIVEVMIQNGFEAEMAAASVQTLADVQGFKHEPPRLSHPGHLLETSDRTVRIVARFEKPCIALLDNLLSLQECNELIKLSTMKLKRSTTVDPYSGEETIIEERTSWGAFFDRNENEFIAQLDRRISEVMNWPIENGEGLQALNYKVGAEYQPHFDYFEDNESGSRRHLETGGQRVSTLIVYLNDVEAGGETIFPAIGLSVTPKAGSAVYFEYFNSLGQVDPLSLHGGAPVLKGEKWIATKWMRQHPYI